MKGNREEERHMSAGEVKGWTEKDIEEKQKKN